MSKFLVHRYFYPLSLDRVAREVALSIERSSEHDLFTSYTCQIVFRYFNQFQDKKYCLFLSWSLSCLSKSIRRNKNNNAILSDLDLGPVSLTKETFIQPSPLLPWLWLPCLCLWCFSLDPLPLCFGLQSTSLISKFSEINNAK